MRRRLLSMLCVCALLAVMTSGCVVVPAGEPVAVAPPPPPPVVVPAPVVVAPGWSWFYGWGWGPYWGWGPAWGWGWGGRPPGHHGRPGHWR